MNKHIEHTLLKQDAKLEDFIRLFDEANEHKFLGVCINPAYVKLAKEHLKDSKIVTVVGFPLGANRSDVKAFETSKAIEDGADEIDMVINIGWLKDKKYDDILSEINEVKKACNGKLLKVIIETCLLTDDEKIKMCQIVSKSDADYIKTSTGFSTAGATKHDIELFKANVTGDTKIKAAGGISSVEDAEEFIKLGASRLGTSRIVKAVKQGNLL